MQSEQNVCEQLVIMGVFRISLQTWQRSDDSSGARPARGVSSQSVLSVTVDTSMAEELSVAARLVCQSPRMQVREQCGGRVKGESCEIAKSTRSRPPTLRVNGKAARG